jgi:hypothetical protein
MGSHHVAQAGYKLTILIFLFCFKIAFIYLDL